MHCAIFSFMFNSLGDKCFYLLANAQQRNEMVCWVLIVFIFSNESVFSGRLVLGESISVTNPHFSSPSTSDGTTSPDMTRWGRTIQVTGA